MLGLRLVIFGLGLVKFGSGQTRVKFSSHFSVNFDLIQGWWSSAFGKMVEQFMSNHNWVGQNYTSVARVLKIIVRVGSGWTKRPRVVSNLWSDFDPTHP